MANNYRGLKPAHRGYRYQDIFTAYFLINAIVEQCDHVIVDTKQTEDDRIDDLEVVKDGKRIRRQIKSSQDSRRPLSLPDFVYSRSSLRIDRLIVTYLDTIQNVVENRLCATWVPPSEDDDLNEYLEIIDSIPSLPRTNTVFYKFNASLIWPEDEEPVFKPLQASYEKDARINRKTFLDFCDLFVIELKLPLSSEDLLLPGPLEQAVVDILRDQIGIGVYPNHGRVAEDVAALTISLANLARTLEDTLTPKEIISNLKIRTDFGRVAQSFPVDENQFYDRPQFRKELQKDILLGGNHLIVGPPGSGKSWEITRLFKELVQQDAIVAKHYCYLDPSDDLIERRVTSEVFLGNLIAEIFEAAKDFKVYPTRFSANAGSLEQALHDLTPLEKPIILIVDGLDHIARVRASSTLLSDDETDIIERLASLDIPHGVSLILVSQPGPHLDTLISRKDLEVKKYIIPQWSVTDSIGLAKKHGVHRFLLHAGVSEEHEVERVLKVLSDKSDGNPLYIKYLSLAMCEGLATGDIDNPIDWLRDIPEIKGDIANYYRYLYDKIIDDAKSIADIFGVIDFSVTENELIEILPPIIKPWVSEALSSLSPVLKKTIGQGGLSIFHESFRRFMLATLEQQGRNVKDVLSPVVDWLKACGFYKDSRSYRFLFQALLRSGLENEVIDSVDVEFVSNSVSYGHPVDPIQQNLALAADIAGRAQNWQILVRCGELRRSLYSCFDVGNNAWDLYWRVFAEIYGPEALAERLLFDGKPTLSYEDGLLACSIIDDQGSTAPWREYLSLNFPEQEYRGRGYDENVLTEHEILDLAVIQGKIRVGQGFRIIRRVYEFLSAQHEKLERSLFIRRLASLLSRMGYEEIVLKLAKRSLEAIENKPKLNSEVGFYLILGVADECESDEKITSLFLPFVSKIKTPENAISCVEVGLDATIFRKINLNPSSIPICVESDQFFDNASKMRLWVASIRLVALATDAKELLDAEDIRVRGTGWYRCWLRFVIQVARAERASRFGEPYSIGQIFDTLVEDVHPFSGKPRACDLYIIHKVIEESLSLSLKLLRDDSDWEYALEKILYVSQETSSRIDREDGGPVPIGTVIEILLPYSANPIVGEKVRKIIEKQVETAGEVGTYYSTHAIFSLKLAQSRMMAGNLSEAKDNFKQAAVYFCSYGWRKDITLLDIIDSVPSISIKSNEVALNALKNLEVLIGGALKHTDGRSTNRFPNAWFRSLLKVNQSVATELLARTILEDEGIENWIVIDAIEDVLEILAGKTDPIIVDALWRTIKFKIEYDNVGERLVKKRTLPIGLLFETAPSLASHRLNNLAAQVANDENSKNKEAILYLKKFSKDHKQAIVCEPETNENSHEYRNKNINKSPKFLSSFKQAVYSFPPNSSYVDMLVGLRRLSDLIDTNDSEAYSSLVMYLGYKLPEMHSEGNERDAIRVIRFWAHNRDLQPYSDVHPLSKLGIYLENANCITLAVFSYALAYVSTRGGGGWLSFGDEKQSSILKKAIALDRELALRTISEEVAYRLRYLDYGAGISKHLIQRIAEWGEHDIAVSSWSEAYEVITHRLPLSERAHYFSSLKLCGSPSWDNDESLIVLILLRLNEPRITRKLGALSGMLVLINHCPNQMCTPLLWCLSVGIPTTSVLLVLFLLLCVEESPYIISKGIKDKLYDYARSECWGAATISRLLLERAELPLPQNCSTPEPSGYSSFSDREAELALTLDKMNVVERLSSRYPGFKYDLLKRFHETLHYERSKERLRERFKLAVGRDGKAHPATPVIYWQDELFISALHTEMTRIYCDNWNEANEITDEEISLLEITMPNLPVHISYYNSRVPRPAWSKPAETVEGEGAPLNIPDDPNYPDWIRLAMVEQEFRSKNGRFSRPEESVTVFSGLLAVPMGRILPSGVFPFQPADPDDWWLTGEVFIKSGGSDLIWPLTGLFKVDDWLNTINILIPPTELMFLLQVEPPKYGDPLIWHDCNNEPVVALRSWWVKGEQFDTESDKLHGSDLIVRPDIISKLETFFGNPVIEFRRVVREDIPNL